MNKQATILLIAALLLCSESLSIVFSQISSSEPVSAPAIEWQKDYGHSGPYDDTNVESASNLIQTSDGGFGYWTDGSITKTDSNNNTQWVKKS